jgi:hypothetical protein
MVTDSMALTVIAFVVSMILIYIIVRKIEDVMDRAVDKVFDKVEDKIHDKFSGYSGTAYSSESDAPVRKEKAVAGENEWKCICGKVNQNYTSMCACGVRKSEAAKRIADNKQKALEIVRRKQLQPQTTQAVTKPVVKTKKVPVTVRRKAEEEWKCICGKNNPGYIGTCMCGMRRSEVMRRREEGQRKAREIMERKAREKREE